MKSFMKKVKEGEQFGREDYQRFFESDISEKTARIDLAKLLDGNWLEKIGEGPSTKYVRTNKGLPDNYILNMKYIENQFINVLTFRRNLPDFTG